MRQFHEGTCVRQAALITLHLCFFRAEKAFVRVSARCWQCMMRQTASSSLCMPVRDMHQRGNRAGDMGVQVYGMAVAVLDDDLRITKLEIFYGEPA